MEAKDALNLSNSLSNSYYQKYIKRIDRLIRKAAQSGLRNITLYGQVIAHKLRKYYEGLGYTINVKIRDEIWPNSEVIEDTVISWGGND